MIRPVPLWTLLGLFCALLALLAVPAPAVAMGEAGVQSLRFQLALPRQIPGGQFWIELERLGEVYEVPLTDDGTIGPDMPWDGVLHGSHNGDYARYVVVRVVGKVGQDPPLVMYTGIEWTGDPRVVELGYRQLIRANGEMDIVRAALAYPNNRMEATMGFRYVVAFGWGLLVLGYVALLLWWRRREGEA